MKRIVKFRGQRTDGKGWVYGDLLTKYIHHEGLTIVKGGCVNYEVKPETVGQYTGLTNIVHKYDVYEGDVISDDGHLIGVVMFGAGTRGWLVKRNLTSAHYETLNDFDPEDSDWEVTGNIHEKQQQ